MEYPTIRNLDGCYFRVERDGRWMNCCFSDLTEAEQERVLDGRSQKFIAGLARHLAERLHSVGEAMDLYME